MRKLVKPISIVLTIVYLILIPLSAFAAIGTTSSNTTNALLSKWKGYGLVDKSVTDKNLYEPIQKIDFITLINGVLKSSKQGDISFSDVPKDSWYGDEIAKAVASGYVTNQDKTKYYPFSNITRLDAAIMIAHVFDLKLSDEKILNKITDAEQLDKDTLAILGAVIENGALYEISKGRYAPSGVLTLIDALKMLDKCVGQLVTKPSTITSNVSGNMLINTGAVTLKNITVSGDLTIGEGVAEGDVSLESVTIKGKLTIRGGGPNSVTIKNTQVVGNLVVEKSAGNVHVKLIGNTTIDESYIKSGCLLEEVYLNGGGKGFVNVTAEKSAIENQTANLKGDFNNIQFFDSNIDVKLNGKVEDVNISKDSNSTFSLIGGNAKDISTQASKNTIEILNGTVSAITVDECAKGNKITINGATTISAITIKGNTTINILKGTVDKLTLESTSEGSYVSMMTGGYLKYFVANASATVTGYGKIDNAYVNSNNVAIDIRPGGVYVASGIVANINGTNIDPSLNNMSITTPNQPVQIQVGKTGNANVSGYPTGSTLAYISSDNNIATVSDKGVITGVSTGTTTIHVTIQYPGYNTSVAAIKVNVTSDNVTAVGSLAISPASYETNTRKDFTITYTAGDDMSNGTVVIKLPNGFSVFENDTVSINGSAEKTLEASQRPDIQTLSFTNLNLKQNEGTIVITLKNRLVPAGGQYEFIAISDADGTGPRLPTSGEEKCSFTSQKLKVLVENANYSTPEPGTTGGSIQIKTLSFVGFTGATKWLINVQNGEFTTAPNFEDTLTGIPYKQGENISVTAGQHMRLAAVDDSNKVKAYKDISIDGKWIRPYNANQLELGTDYFAPESGVQANTVRLKNLNISNISGAAIWMIKVQNNAATDVFVNQPFVGGQEYVSGNDISVFNTQHIILAATTSGGSIKAYADMKVNDDMVSKPAGELMLENNYSLPTYGPTTGTTTIQTLNNGGVGGFPNINKWMIVTLSAIAVTPAVDISTAEYEKYTQGNTFNSFTTGNAITVEEGQHILLVGVDDSGTANKIKAYVDLTIDATQIRQADAPKIPDVNFAIPTMGSTAGSTRFTSLNFSTPISGATKYMFKVQDDVFAAPQLNSTLSLAKDCAANQNIDITLGQHLILLATDNNGRIKAYMDIVVNNSSQIRPVDILKLKVNNDYTLLPGTVDGSTKIILSTVSVPSGFSGCWMYKVQDTAFETPYKGSIISGTAIYATGENIKPISVGQHILILAVNTSGEAIAYTDEIIRYDQIKQPDATKLLSNTEVTANESYNYSVPEPGSDGGMTKIATLSTMGIQGATKWLYQISANPVTIPAYNSIINGLPSYIVNTSIKVTAGQHFALYAADSTNSIKGFRDITIGQDQIRTPAATLLVSPTNYSAPTAGSTPGAIVISSLSFVGLDNQSNTLSWKYAVGDNRFSAPALNSSVSAIGFTTNPLTTTTDIAVKAQQYVLLLAVDASGAIKGYANIEVQPSAIRPYDADPIAPTSYSLIKGSAEGTTCFNNLNPIGIPGQTAWMTATQKGSFAVPAKDLTVAVAAYYNLNKDIKIEAGSHILLLATDQSGRVKAYADIIVSKDQIQAPSAMLLTPTTNYTDPQQGTSPGAIKIMLNDALIPRATGETIAWKYKVGTVDFRTPLLDEDATGYNAYESNGDIQVVAGNIVLVVAVVSAGSNANKIKAYRQFTISSSQIKPANAPELILNLNYKEPIAGSTPGTTKIPYLDKIGVVGGDNAKWQVKTVNTAEIPTLNSIFTTPIDYASGADITVKMNQYVELALVDTSGRVKAYKNFWITQDSQLNPPLANQLVSVKNYSTPKYGTTTGTTSIYVSPEGISGFKEFAVKVGSIAENITAGSIISYTTGSGIDFTDYRSYTSGADISASSGQYIQLVAVDSASKVIAYANIGVLDSSVRPGNAVLLKKPDNYSELVPGAGVGTTKFTDLNFIGVPGDEKIWIVKVLDSSPAAILMNSSVEGATVYDVQKDIGAKEGQYVLLCAVDSIGRIKGYASIQVQAANVRGVAPILKLGTEYSSPVPGSKLNTTKFAANTLNLPTGAVLWKYAVQDSAAATILKDSLLSGLTTYTTIGDDIVAVEGQHLILVATDNSGYTKAYADIPVVADNLRNVEATLSGTIITSPTGEANIVSGGRTVIVKLAFGEWKDDVLTDTTKRNTLFDGFIASGTEQTQWGKVIAALKSEGMSAAVMNSTKDTITITLSEALLYDITMNQEVSLTIKPELIKNAVKAVTAVNKINISANVVAQLVVQSETGTVITQGLGEGDIKAGGKKLIIELINGEFTQDVATSSEKRNAIFDGFKATYDQAMWNKVTDSLKIAGEAAITRNTSKKITIVLPAIDGSIVAGDYDITMNDTINLVLPYQTTSGEAILVGAIRNVAIPTQLSITANSSADLSGTLFSSAISESNIVAGGKTLIITLTDGQWVTDITSDATKRNALFSGLSASTETTEWVKVITALKDAGQAAITRTSNSAIELTLPAASTYNISSNQYITVNIPAMCIIGAKANLIAGKTFTIEREASLTLTGTVIGSSVTETDIKLGGKTIILTLNNATWADNIATDTDTKDALFNGFKADAEQEQLDLLIAKLKSSAIITKTAPNSITITLPAASNYDITSAKQTIYVTVPTSAAIGTSFKIQSTNAMVVNSTPPVAAYIVKVSASLPQTGDTYKLGDIITINVEFNTAVDVVGTPVINLETGAVDRNAIYTTGSGISVLTFEYQVQAGDTSQDLEYKLATSLVLQGASISNSGSSVKANTNLPLPGSEGSLSYTSNVKVDAVAPKFSTGYPKVDTKTETTADILVKVDKAAQIYYVVVPNDIYNVTPSVEQILAGQNAQGVTVSGIMTGMKDTVENVEVRIGITTLSAITAYTIYSVAVDSLNNRSGVSALNFTTLDTTPPQFVNGYPIQQSIYDNKIDIGIKTNEDGYVYMIAVPTGSPTPTSAQVVSYMDKTIALNLRATAAITSGTAITLSATGLPVSSTYDIYVVCVDKSNNIIADAAVVSQAKTSQLSLLNVGVDLTKSILTNTTTQMEYSFDELLWYPCTATNTIITYNDNVENLAIFIREAKNTTNTRDLPVLIRGDKNIIDISQIDYDIAAKKVTNNSAINLQYRINGGAWGTLNASGSAINVDFVPGPLEVRTAATQTTLPSIEVEVDVIAVQMLAPNLQYNDDENTIEGLDSKYEYSIDGGSSWKTGVVEGTFAGTKTVEVREKATKERLPSKVQIIQFTAGVIKVVAAPVTIDKMVVTITFEENTNKKTLSVQNIRDCLLVGTWNTTSGAIITQHDWGTDFTTMWNTTGNAITITYNTLSGASIKIGDEVRITTASGIRNAAQTSDYYTSRGELTGSFHTVPAIAGIKAVNVTSGSIGFDDGDSIIITFDQPTKATTFSAIDIGKYLKVTDKDGKAKPTAWAAVTTDSSIVWNTSGTALTITFDNASATTTSSIEVTDKITISPLLGLSDADETTEACNTSSFISGSFTSTPKIVNAYITNVGASGKNVNDTITIKFNQPTNKKQIKGYFLNSWLKLVGTDGKTHSWGTQADAGITWSDDGTTLTIVLSSIVGVTLSSSDTLTLDVVAGIKAADDQTSICVDSYKISGAF